MLLRPPDPAAIEKPPLVLVSVVEKEATYDLMYRSREKLTPKLPAAGSDEVSVTSESNQIPSWSGYG